MGSVLFTSLSYNQNNICCNCWFLDEFTVIIMNCWLLVLASCRKIGVLHEILPIYKWGLGFFGMCLVYSVNLYCRQNVALIQGFSISYWGKNWHKPCPSTRCSFKELLLSISAISLFHCPSSVSVSIGLISVHGLLVQEAVHRLLSQGKLMVVAN